MNISNALSIQGVTMSQTRIFVVILAFWTLTQVCVLCIDVFYIFLTINKK